MAKVQIDISNLDADGRHRISVVKSGAFGRSPVHIDGLLQTHPAWATLCRLYGSTETDTEGRQLVETDQAAGAISVLPSVLAGLNHADAQALGAPPPLPLALDMRSDGMIFDPDFRVISRFVGGGGTIVRPDLSGALAQHEGRRFRVPQPLFALLEAARRLQAPIASEPARLEAIAKLKATLPPDLDLDISDGYLRDLRLLYAASISLALKPSGDSIDIDPVLFGRSASEAASDGDLLDEDEFALLTPNEQQRFASESFVRSGEAKPAYSLGGNTYVYVDPALRPVLRLVRRMQQSDGETRKRFALDPRQAIREDCGIADDALLNSLFIETEQFSERVTGLDVWRKPVLPWIKPRPNSWLPDKLGLKVGDTSIEIAPAQAIDLARALEVAVAEDRSSLAFEGVEIPATQQALESVRAIARVAEAARIADATDAPEREPAPPPADLKIFLTVKDNLESLSLTQSPTGRVDPIPAPELPRCLRTKLKPHQLEGFAWLSEHLERGIHGALLADDMGLGKTLQALAALASRWEQGLDGRRDGKPSLIVAPTGLLTNWQDEIERHLQPGAFGNVERAYGSDLRLLRDGAGTQRDTAIGRSTLDVSRWRDAGLVLTTYETLRDYHLSFARVRFACIVFDEAQKAKNPASQITRAAKTLNAELKLAMTGTPVENRLQDVWSITDMVWAGRLGSSQQFARSFPETSVERIRELSQSLTTRSDGASPPFMLRRLKKDSLAGLPTKTVHPRSIEMPPQQAAAYFDVIARALAAEGARSPGAMLATLMSLRQISLHPERPESASGDLVAWARKSARLSATIDILDAVKAANEKALIFVEDLDMQDVVAALVAGRYGLKRRPDRISGEIAGPKRQAIVRRFQEQGPGFDVLILSPKAGGVGLTITAANHVIHLTRWWNPAVEDQATDRVYRIGQDKPVTVHVPLAVHPDPTLRDASFDIRLDALLSRKRNLSENLLLPVDRGEADLAGLFGDVLRSGPAAALEAAPIPQPPASPPAVSATPDPVLQNPVAPAKRPVLSLSKAPPATTADANGTAPVLRHWTIQSGEARRYADYFAVFHECRITKLSVIDPYCMTPSNRQALAAFVGEVAGIAAGVDLLHITAWSPTARSMRESSIETPEAARADFKTRLAQRVKPTPEVKVTFVESGRTYRGDFHDRDIFFDTFGPEGAQIWYMNLSGGVDRLFDRDRKCEVILKPVKSRR